MAFEVKEAVLGHTRVRVKVGAVVLVGGAVVANISTTEVVMAPAERTSEAGMLFGAAIVNGHSIMGLT